MKGININSGLEQTQFDLPHQINYYQGKVREVYTLGNDYLAMVATDRISAFDHILPKPIPYKGEVLTQIAAHFLNATKDIVPNWLIECPHPTVSFGYQCEPIKLEMVIRGYLVGHAWREYKSGKRLLCGEALPEGMIENQKFDKPIITPATKADEGHDVDISKTEIIEQQIVSKQVYEQLEEYTHKLYARGCEMASERGLILVDTKYEFGIYKGEIMLIDEVHTPDSSRYFYADDYETKLQNGEAQKHLSKEFVREWLMERGFQGLDGQEMPVMSDEDVKLIMKRYFELYEIILNKPFKYTDRNDLVNDIKSALTLSIQQHLH